MVTAIVTVVTIPAVVFFGTSTLTRQSGVIPRAPRLVGCTIIRKCAVHAGARKAARWDRTGIRAHRRCNTPYADRALSGTQPFGATRRARRRCTQTTRTSAYVVTNLEFGIPHAVIRKVTHGAIQEAICAMAATVVEADRATCRPVPRAVVARPANGSPVRGTLRFDGVLLAIQVCAGVGICIPGARDVSGCAIVRGKTRRTRSRRVACGIGSGVCAFARRAIVIAEDILFVATCLISITLFS